MDILFVDETNVFEPSFGGEQRSNLLLRACCRIANVDLVLFKKYQIMPNIEKCRIVYENDLENRNNLWNEIKKFFSFNHKCISGVNKRREKIISDLIKGKKYDFIVVRYVDRAICAGLLKYADKLVIDIDDNPVACMKNRFSSPEKLRLKKVIGQLYLKIKLPFVKKAFDKIITNTKISFVSNCEDIGIYESSSVYLPNVPFTEPDVKYCDFSVSSRRVIWVGVVNFPPNYLGLEHFFDCIYPKVLAKIPDFEIVIVGKYGNYDVNKWRNLQGVHVKGFVEDLETEYASARAAIVPVYMGAGTNIKVLEAMRMKRPCITTECGSRGYDTFFEENRDYIVCKNDDDFATSIIEMLEDEQKNHTMSNRGFEKVLKFFSQDSFFYIVSSAFNKL